MQMPGNRNFTEKGGDRNLLGLLDVRAHPYIGQGVFYEIAQAQEAAAQHRSSSSVDGDSPAFQRIEREQRGVEDVPNFMSQMPGALDFFMWTAIRR